MSESDLRKLPNIGTAMAGMLARIGVEQAADLVGRDPGELYHRLYGVDGRRHDPCVLDTLTAVVDFAGGAPARPWWFYSRRRKAGADVGEPARPSRRRKAGADAAEPAQASRRRTLARGPSPSGR